MKNYKRIYGLLMLLVTAIFIIFEVSAIAFSFNMAIDREIEDLKNTNNIFSNAIQSSIEMLDDIDITEDTDMINYISDNLYNNLQNKSVIYIVENNTELLYQSRLFEAENDQEGQYSRDDQWYINHFESGESNFLQISNKILIGNKPIYIKTIIDVSEIYLEREALLKHYSIIVFSLFIFFAIGLFLLSWSFEKSVRLSEKMTQMEVVAQRQEEFSASFAHECKTPLTSIIGYSDLLRSNNLSNEEQKESAEYIFAQGKRLERLTKQMMVLSNLRDEELDKEQIDAAKLINNVAMQVKKMMDKKNVTFDVLAEQGALFGSEDLYQSLLINLLDNARKAVLENGTVSIIGKSHTNYYEIKIIDDGMGMDEKTIEKMTLPFYMADKARTRKEGGAGLGMAIVGQIAKRENIKIDVQSALNKGTRITLKIPKEKELQHEK